MYHSKTDYVCQQKFFENQMFLEGEHATERIGGAVPRHGDALRARAATLRLELAAMPRSGRARRELETRIARLEQMAGETLRTAGYLAHYYDPD